MDEKILALKKERKTLWEKAKAFLDSNEKNGMLSTEATSEYEKMEADIDAIGKHIKRLENQKELEKEMNGIKDTVIKTEPTKAKDEKTGIATNEYNDAFWNVVKKNRYSNALEVGTDSEGGYLVPDEFERTLVEALTEENAIRGLATVIRTASGDRKIPVVASTGTASWVDEEGLIEDSDDAFGQVSLGAHKLATMIKVSEELLNDSAFNLESYIATQFGKRFGTVEESAFIVGDADGKPTGLLHATAGASAGVTTAGASITADEIIDLYYSLKAPYRSKAVFVLNDDTVKAIRKLKDGAGNYIWQPSLSDGTPATILGCRVITSPSMPKVESGAKAILFGDLSYYWIADRQNIIFKRLNELYATNGQVGFMATKRVDAKLILPEAVKTLAIKA